MKTTLLFVFIFSSFLAFSQCNLNIEPNTHSRVLRTTGNTKIDNFIYREKGKMENLFGVKVDLNIAYGANGLALKSCESSNCHGTIELGVDILKAQLEKTSGNWMIMAIMAHEFAHIIQFKNNMSFSSNVQQEIHADILAGWYIGKCLLDMENSAGPYERFDAQQKSRDIIDDLRWFFGEMGDESYFSPYHHGNFGTRLMAMHNGMRASHTKGLEWSYTFLQWGKEDAQHYIDDWNH